MASIWKPVFVVKIFSLYGDLAGGVVPDLWQLIYFVRLFLAPWISEESCRITPQSRSSCRV